MADVLDRILDPATMAASAREAAATRTRRGVRPDSGERQDGGELLPRMLEALLGGANDLAGRAIGQSESLRTGNGYDASPVVQSLLGRASA